MSKVANQFQRLEEMQYRQESIPLFVWRSKAVANSATCGAALSQVFPREMLDTGAICRACVRESVIGTVAISREQWLEDQRTCPLAARDSMHVPRQQGFELFSTL